MPAPFQTGETLGYEVRYLGLTAGELSLELRSEPKHSDRLRIRSRARTLNAADSLLRIRSDSFCVVERRRLLPLLCRSSFSIRGNDRRREVKYDREAGRVKETILEEGEVERHTRELDPDGEQAQEMLSAMYLARTMPLEPGSPVRFHGWRGKKRVIVECIPETVESVELPAGPRRALRLAVRVKEKAHPHQSDGGHVWVSDDPRRVPLKMSFDGPLGSVEAVLVRTEGLLPGPVLTARR